MKKKYWKLESKYAKLAKKFKKYKKNLHDQYI